MCLVCGARYKTRPGLSYHYTHSHNNTTDAADDENTAPSPPKPAPSTTTTGDPLAGLKKFQDSFLSFLKHPGMVDIHKRCDLKANKGKFG